jgi:hypothetical protein
MWYNQEDNNLRWMICRNGEWGDHVTLQAAADYYGVKISLITSFKDTCFIEIVPKQHKSKRGHYNSFFILKSHLAIVCIMLAYISSTNFVQGYGKQCV